MYRRADWRSKAYRTSGRIGTGSAPRVASTLTTLNERNVMLSWSLVFLIVALIAGLLGFTGVAGAAAGVAKVLFFVFLILLIISAIAAAIRGRPPV